MSLVIRLGALILLALVSSRAKAETLTTLFSFDGTHGSYPYGDLTLSGSTQYGMTGFALNLNATPEPSTQFVSPAGVALRSLAGGSVHRRFLHTQTR